MDRNISHRWDDESLEAKARWFHSLSLQERMDIFCYFTDLILENNPNIMKNKDAKPTSKRVLIVTKP